jgi:uncharacterized membrane protein (UPF0136 family)
MILHFHHREKVKMGERLRPMIMNGLKVYLKSWVSLVYYYAQLACMILLLINGILQMEWLQAPVEVVGANFFGAAVLLVGFFLPRRLRKRLRLLPGVLIALGGLAMYWTTRGEKAWEVGNWPETLSWAGIVAMVGGLGQAFLDVRGWVKLSPRSLRIKRSFFPTRRIEWGRVKDVYVEEGALQVQLRDGGKLSLRLSQGDSQTIRSRIDQIFREALAYQTETQEKTLAGMTPEGIGLGQKKPAKTAS